MKDFVISKSYYQMNVNKVEIVLIIVILIMPFIVLVNFIFTLAIKYLKHDVLLFFFCLSDIDLKLSVNFLTHYNFCYALTSMFYLASIMLL